MLQVCIPANREREAQWICSVLLREFLGLEYVTVPVVAAGYSLRLNGAQLDLPDLFFACARGSWLKPASLPGGSIEQWDLPASSLHIPHMRNRVPVIFGAPGIELGDKRVQSHVDIFGTVFYMLSRYEEIVKPDRDVHDRFPAKASLAHEAGFLQRAIVDEYVEVLWACMKRLWPQLERRPHHGDVFVTCDVDRPFDRARGAGRVLRSLGADLIRRRDLRLAARRARNVVASRHGDYRFDPYDTFDWYMEACERASRKAAFYFIPDNSEEEIDGCYELVEPRIQALIHDISERGHEVGVHGSYNSYRDGAQIARERQRMIRACEKAGADVSVRGNRQHYLRWDAGRTPRFLDAAGFAYDTSGSFADVPGFRYGTARSFTMWDWQNERPLTLKQRPLIAMESSPVWNSRTGVDRTDEALDLMVTLKVRALQFGGDFTLLWHNSNLLTSKDREVFVELIK
jgi:hypothetical protein